MFFKKTNAKMAKIKLIAVATLTAIIAGGFMYFVGMGTPHRTIIATGECTARVERDRTAITIRITVLDDNAATSLRRGQDIYTHIITYLTALDEGSLVNELQTIRFDSAERRQWDHNRQMEVSMGFETNIELSVQSENRRLIERILSDLTGFENVFPGNLQMTSSPAATKRAMDACLRDAVEHARQNANQIAEADGRRVGRMTNAEFTQTTSGGNIQPRPMMMRAQAVAFAGDMGGGLFASDGELSVVVNAAFRLR